MRATVMYEAGDVRIEDVPDARPSQNRPTRSSASPAPASAAATSGRTPTWSRPRPASRWATRPSASSRTSAADVHAQARRSRRDALRVLRRHLRVLPEGLHTACVHGGFFGNGGRNGGAQAEALRVPLADGTLYPLTGRRGPRADAVAPHPLRRARHRPPRGGRRPASSPASRSPSWATAPSGCAASSPPSASAPSRSSSWAAISDLSTWPSIRRDGHRGASAARRPSARDHGADRRLRRSVRPRMRGPSITSGGSRTGAP